MKLFFIAGIVYLTGVAVVLALRPRLMFTEQGIWKEFAIGGDPDTHTWFPFWLFCILWAILAYLLVVLFSSNIFWSNRVEVEAPAATKGVKRIRSIEKVKPGYYMLNTEGTGIEGVPKYIYLGPAPPDAGQD